MNIFSLFRPADSRKLLLQNMPRGAVCAEIGVWQGDFSERILKETRPQALHLIDPWKFAPDFPGRWYGGDKAKSQADMDAVHRGVTTRFAQAAMVTVHRLPSLEAAGTFQDATFDWVYIDGDHSYEAVLRDLQAWAPKVKMGGLITGDDYHWKDESGQKSVRRAVQEFAVARKSLARLTIHGGQFILPA